MTILKGLKKVFIERSSSLTDIWNYFLGNYRYKLYYSRDKLGAIRAYGEKHPLMRSHIWEQIKWRVKWMDKKCFENGSCKLCGCETTALQMCNKSCDKPCYPPMMTKKQWRNFWESPFTREFGYLDRHNRVWKIEDEGKPVLTRTITIQDLIDYVSENTRRPGDN